MENNIPKSLLGGLGSIWGRVGRSAQRRTLRDALLAIVFCVLLAAALSDYLAPPPAWLAPGLAAAALCLAVMCAIRLQLLEFAPEVLAGDVIVPRPGRTGGDLKLLLPLQFTNAGAAGGIVQWVALRLTIDGDAARCVLLSPIAEVDMQRFLQAKRRLSEDNTIDAFTAFALDGKRSIAKFVLFEAAEKNRSRPLVLRPGRYTFELFLKSTAQRAPKLERVFEHVVEAKHVEEFSSDLPVYLIDYPMTLPAARQKLAGAEWMPRAARYSG